MKFDISTLTTAITFILYVIFTVFGLFQYKVNRIRSSFLLYMAAMTIWSAGSFMMHSMLPVWTPIGWNRFMLIGLLAIPITFFQSLVDLVGRYPKRRIQLFILGYVIWGYLLVLNFTGRIVSYAGFSNNEFVYQLGDRAYVAYILSYAFLVFAIIAVGREIYRASDPLVTKRLSPLLAGGIILLLGVMVNLYEPLGKYPIDVFAGTVNGLLIFYSIYKYRLVHYSQTVLQGIAYFFLSVIAALLFSKIMSMISPSLREIPFQQRYFASFVIAAISALVFQPVWRGAVWTLEKLYFGKRIDYYQSLRAFSSNLALLKDLDTLVTVTTEKIYQTFELTWGFMTVLDYGQWDYRLVAHHGLDISAEEAAGVTFRRNSALFEHAVFFHERRPERQSFFYPLTAGDRTIVISPQLVIPLRFRERVNGYLVLGRKRNKEYFDQLDLETLQIFTGQCSIALENAVSFERLKRQQKRLQEMNNMLLVSNRKLDAFFDGITAPVSLQDINYNIVLANAAAAKTFGVAASDMAGQKCYKVFFGRERPCQGCMAQDSLHTNLPLNAEIHRDRTDTTFATHFYPITVPEDTQKLFLEFFQDISEQKLLRAEIIQSAKLAGIGTLASGIAHEINNPLTAISATAEVILEDAPENSPLQEYAQDILDCAQNAAVIIKDLTTYSRRESGAPGTSDLVSTVDMALKMALRGTDGSELTVTKSVPESVEVKGNSNELRQVFLNLLLNAIQAMDGKGRLTVSADVQDSHARLSIGDTGKGMSEATIQNIFTPFFTTKPPGEGTGLGLSVAYQIVNKTGGRILVDSTPDVGTTMTVLLPLAQVEYELIQFVQARSTQELRDVFFLQRKILVGEKGYREETIHRPQDDMAFHIIAYKGIQPVGAVTCVLDAQAEDIPIFAHFPAAAEIAERPAAEIDRLVVVKNERGGIVPLGLMMLAYMHAKSRNVRAVFLDVFADDKKQSQMYAKVGFEEIGTYFDPLEVRVMVLRDRLSYEQNQKHLHHFLRPLVTRLIEKIDFDPAEERAIRAEAERILTS